MQLHLRSWDRVASEAGTERSIGKGKPETFTKQEARERHQWERRREEPRLRREHDMRA